LSFVISNPAQAADFLVERAKNTKKEQLRAGDRCSPTCTTPPGMHCFTSQFTIIRDGSAELIYTVDDDDLYVGFAIGARFFSGHIVSMTIDEETLAGTHRLIVCSADRKGVVEWREVPYDVSAYGLAWGAVGRPSQPTGMSDTVNKDIVEQMTEQSAEDIIAMMNGIIRRRPDFSMAEVRAATDLATIQMVQDLPYRPIKTVMLIAMPGSQRLAALSNRGIPVVHA